MLQTLKRKKVLGKLSNNDPQKYRSMPSLCWPAVVFLDGYLTKDMRVLEWGSGGSTIWFARRVAEVYSIEHDPEYAHIVTGAAEYWGLENIHLIFVSPEEGDLSGFESRHSDYHGYNFEKYVKAPWQFSGSNDFDLIMVDGRARAACLKAALPRLKDQALLVLDDCDRLQYQEGIASVPYPYIEFVGPVPYYNIAVSARLRIWGKGLENVSPT